jgi:ArsR family transcriptional regulator
MTEISNKGPAEMKESKARAGVEDVARYADMFAAIGTDARLRILRLLLAAHPEGLVVSEVQAELGIPASTLSHHLEKLRHEGLVTVQREGTFLRYAANTETLRELLGFLYAECCTRNRAVNPKELAWVGRSTVSR